MQRVSDERLAEWAEDGHPSITRCFTAIEFHSMALELQERRAKDARTYKEEIGDSDGKARNAAG